MLFLPFCCFSQAIILFIGLALPIFASEPESESIAVRNKRVKRSFSWPFFGGSSADETETSNVASDDSIVTVAADAIPQQYVLPSQIQVPTQLHHQLSGLPYSAPSSGVILNHGNMHYPIYRVHKYNGVHLKPIPVSLVGHVDNNGIVVAPEQPHSTDGDENGIETENDDKDSVTVDAEADTDTDTDADVDAEPPKKNNIPFKITPELVSLARRLGIKDVSKLPPLDDAMILLGTTSQDDTIKAIQELAATDDGLNLIKQYLNPEGAEGAASETVEQYALPREQSDPLVPEQSISLETVLPGFDVNPFGPVAALDATLDRSRTSLGILKGFVPTPAPNEGFLSKIVSWTNRLNPLAGREEIPIPSFAEADAEEVIQSQYPVSGDTVAIPTLPELTQLPVIAGLDTHAAQVPGLPQIHIPQGYVLPHNYHRTSAGAGGPYIRVKLPLSGFNPTPEIPIQAQYLNHYQRQVAAATPHHQLRVPSAHPPPTFYQRKTPIVNHVSHPPAPVAHVHSAPPPPPPSYTQIGQLPLSDVNYDIFKNAPRIVSSYGTPALPYSYPEDNPGASFSSSSAVATPSFDLRIAASEAKERSVPAPVASTTNTAEEKATLDTIVDQIAQPVDAPKSDLPVDVVAPVDSVHKVTETVAPTAAEKKQPAKTTIQRRSGTDSEANTNYIVTPQRISAYDSFATGKLHTADPDAINNMFPFTVQYAQLNSEAKWGNEMYT